MRKKLIAVVGAALLLSGCSGNTPQSAAEECGGEEAGISMDGDVLKYDQDDDATGDAWTCLLEVLVPDKDEQYAMTQKFEAGQSGNYETKGYTIVYGMSPTGSLRLFFNSDA